MTNLRHFEGAFTAFFARENVSVFPETVRTLVPVTIVFAASLSTGLGFFDSLAKLAGAGTLVPITGFSNAVISPALDDKSEGLVMGVGAKMFTIAGPVIVYGTAAAFIYGVIYWVIKIM